jgi:predicted aconitase with swiveling domain
VPKVYEQNKKYKKVTRKHGKIFLLPEGWGNANGSFFLDKLRSNHILLKKIVGLADQNLNERLTSC